jgi:hypothetical protein
MPYKLMIDEKDVFGKGKFANAKGNTECVEFVRQGTGAPETSKWKKGLVVKGAPVGSIFRGTAIATFDDFGTYPTDNLGKHAAVYLLHTDTYIQVLDQWNSQGEVLQRVIWFDRSAGTSRSNDGNTFYVIE